MKKNSCLNFVFVGFFVCFMVLHLIVPDRTFSEEENRYLKEFPEITLENSISSDTFREIETYIKDQFPSRSFFVSVKTRIDSLMNKRLINGVFLSDHDTLIKQFNSIDEGRYNINLSKINNFVETIEGTPVDVLVIPTAASINSDTLPPYSQNIDEEVLLQTIREDLSGVEFIDVFSTMKNIDENLYYASDHHLNTWGTYLMYEEFMNHQNVDKSSFTFEKMSNNFSGSLSSKSGAFWINQDEIYKPVSSNELDIEVIYDKDVVTDSVFNDERLNTKDKYTYYLDGNHGIVEIDTHQDDKENLLVITDSYGHSLAPFLLDHYNQITFIDLRYYRNPVSSLVENFDRVLFYYGIESFVGEASIAYLR